MVKCIYILIFVFITSFLNAQGCKEQFVSDSLYKPAEKTKVAVSLININLKNGGNIQLINNNGKYVLKLALNEKFGFLETGSLEIKSGGKSFFIKNTTLYDIKEPTSYFLVDILINYVATLKDDGITSVVFNGKFEAKIAKEDVTQIKKAAKCFYELHRK